MGEVLETCERPYTWQHPVVCMDRQRVQLVKDTRETLLATQNRPQWVDFEYERAGTAAVIVFQDRLVAGVGRTRTRRTTWWASWRGATPAAGK